MSAGERLYRLLLRLYPPAFRRELEADMLQAYRDWRREARYRGPLGRLRLGMRMLADLARSLPREWWHQPGGAWRPTARREGGSGGRGGPVRRGRTRGEEGTGMGTIIRDVGFAARTFLRRPGFALATVATLAVGIAGATTMFSVLDGVVLRPLPYADAERLVQVGIRYPGRDALGSVSPAELHLWREEVGSVQIAGARLQAMTLVGDGEPEILDGAGVSGSFFRILDVDPARGRLFGPEEDRTGAEPVAVLTHGTWTRRWGADDSVIGRRVVLDGVPFTVVGVLPSDFVPPEAIYHGDVDVYFPLQHVADDVSPTVVADAFLQVIGRLAEGVGIDAARAQLRATQVDLLLANGRDPDSREVGAAALHARTVGDFGRTLVPFLGAVGLLLLVACANVANLSLVRATERGREMAVRTALGAGRGRLARQLLTESLVTAVAASAAGAALAWGAVAAFRRFAPSGLPRAAEVTVDPRVLLFALGLAVITGLLFGLAPVLHVLGSSSGSTLREREGGTGGGGRLRSVLVVGEVAMALVLFVGAALLAGSFVRLVNTDLGFEPQGLAWMTVAPDGERWESPEARVELIRSIHRRLADHPGVVAVGGTSNLPLSGNQSVRNITVEGFTPGPDTPENVSYSRVLPGHFVTTGIDVRRGREFTWVDDDDAAPVVVVNEALASHYWPGGDALGSRMHFGSPESDWPWMEVVGVVEDIRQLRPGEPPLPELYIPFAAVGTGLQTVVVRAEGDPAPLLEAMRAALRAEAPELPVYRTGTMDQVLSDAVVAPRFYTLVLGAFAGVSLLLAVIGVYGTMAYAVRQRTRELGVRMALGADRGSVRGMVLGRGLALTAAGLAVGVVLSLLSTRVLEDFVYGVTPTDPATIAGAALALAAAAAVASWVPAVRATRIDPVEALRAD